MTVEQYLVTINSNPTDVDVEHLIRGQCEDYGVAVEITQIGGQDQKLVVDGYTLETYRGRSIHDFMTPDWELIFDQYPEYAASKANPIPIQSFVTEVTKALTGVRGRTAQQWFNRLIAHYGLQWVESRMDDAKFRAEIRRRGKDVVD